MGRLETSRPRSTFVTVVATLLLVWSGISAAYFAITALFLSISSPPPDDTLESWLANPDIHPGPFLVFLMEHPLVPAMMMLALFVVLTPAAYGTLKRRNRDRLLVLAGLTAYIAMRGYNVYLATATEMTPVSAADRSAVFASGFDVVLSLAAIAFFAWPRVRAEFDDSGAAIYAWMRRTRTSAGVLLRTRASTGNSLQRTPRATAPHIQSGTHWLGLMQLTLAAILAILGVAATKRTGIPFIWIALAYVSIFAVTLLRDFVVSSLLAVVIGVAGAFGGFAASRVSWVLIPPFTAPLASLFATANVGLAIVAAVAFLLRPPPHEPERETVEPVAERAVILTALARAILVIASVMAVQQGRGAVALLTESRVIAPTNFVLAYFGFQAPRTLAIAMTLFWTATVFAAIALLQRRRFAVPMLQTAALLYAIGRIVSALGEIAFVFSRTKGAIGAMVFSEWPAALTAGAALGLALFLHSPPMREEITNRTEPLPRDGAPAIPTIIRAFAIIYVLSLPGSFFAIRPDVWLWTLAFLALYRIPLGAILIAAAGVAAWTLTSTRARSAPPKPVRDAILLLCIATTIVAGASLVPAVRLFLNGEWQHEALGGVLGPLALAVLLWIPATRLVGVALSGVISVFWLPAIVPGPLSFAVVNLSESESHVEWFQIVGMISSLAMTLCVLSAAVICSRLFLGNPGTLPRDSAV